jgi:hydroxyquinol 1,2-dioxygenase
MKTPLNAYNITDQVIRHADRKRADPRLFQIYSAFIRHLHDFAREVRLTEPELQAGRNFLNAAVRNTTVIPDGELHMLTDLSGLSELVELMADEGRGSATERNLEGPLYVADAPWRADGEPLGVDDNGDKLVLWGHVRDDRGAPIAGAVVDAWQAASNSLYDIQDPQQPRGNFRGRYITDAQGRYTIETIVPPGYRVPDEGPSGDLLRRLGRHPWRAGHIHFKLSAPAHQALTTQLFIDRDPHLESDTTFAVRSGLLQLRALGASEPQGAAYESRFDFVLARSVGAPEGLKPRRSASATTD